LKFFARVRRTGQGAVLDRDKQGPSGVRESPLGSLVACSSMMAATYRGFVRPTNPPSDRSELCGSDRYFYISRLEYLCNIMAIIILDDASARNVIICAVHYASRMNNTRRLSHHLSGARRPSVTHFSAGCRVRPRNDFAVTLPFNRESCTGALARSSADRCCRKPGSCGTGLHTIPHDCLRTEPAARQRPRQ
jgi:hypothetical protein